MVGGDTIEHKRDQLGLLADISFRCGRDYEFLGHAAHSSVITGIIGSYLSLLKAWSIKLVSRPANNPDILKL